MHIHRYTKVFNLVGVYSSCTNTRDHTADKVWRKVVYMHPLLRLSTMNGRNIPCACVHMHVHVQCTCTCMCTCMCLCACACACCVCMCVCMCVCTCMCNCLCIYHSRDLHKPQFVYHTTSFQLPHFPHMCEL